MPSGTADLQEGNVMLSVKDPAMLDEAVAEEWSSPTPSKMRGDNEIYVSAAFDLPDKPGVPIISDFGDAQFGDPPFREEVMPDLYRPPEMVLGIPWDEKLDIWALGLMVRATLFQPESPFP
jgi:serine/threonine protein kinase